MTMTIEPPAAGGATAGSGGDRADDPKVVASVPGTRLEGNFRKPLRGYRARPVHECSRVIEILAGLVAKRCADSLLPSSSGGHAGQPALLSILAVPAPAWYPSLTGVLMSAHGRDHFAVRGTDALADVLGALAPSTSAFMPAIDGLVRWVRESSSPRPALLSEGDLAGLWLSCLSDAVKASTCDAGLSLRVGVVEPAEDQALLVAELITPTVLCRPRSWLRRRQGTALVHWLLFGSEGHLLASGVEALAYPA
jgi:hypothetical protein